MARNGSGTYVRVHDWTDDRDAAIPITASRVDEEMDDVATALTNSLAKDGQTTPTANLPMGGFKLTGLGSGSARTDSLTAGQVQDSATQHGTVGGTANAITLTVTPAITAYAAGQRFSFVAGAVNTGAVTLNVSAVGAKAITKNGTAALVGGEIANGALIEVIYDGTQFQLVSNNPTEATAFWGGTSGGTANAQTVTLAPVPGAYYAGMVVTFLAGNTNTGATTLNCNSLGAKSIFVNNAACAGGEILSGKAYTVVYDGTQFQMLSAAGAMKGLIGYQRFIVAGTSTYTPTAGTRAVYVEVVGGGGGGGGCATTGAGQAAMGSGAGAGGYARGWVMSGFSGVTVTVGAKGTGGTAGANNGTDGAASSFGAAVAANGGTKGLGGSAVTPPTFGPNVGAGGTATAGDQGISGNQGAFGFALASTASNVLASAGGNSAWGKGGVALLNATGTAGSAGSGYGAGGAGGINIASQGTGKAGGDGTAGAVFVWEFG